MNLPVDPIEIDGIESTSDRFGGEKNPPDDFYVSNEKMHATDSAGFIESSFLGNSYSKVRNFFVLSVFVGIFLTIQIRFFYLQGIRGGYYWQKAEGNRQQVQAIPSERGLMYDYQGILLTTNVPKFSLAVVPQHLPKAGPDRDAVIIKLSSITGRDKNDIESLLKEYGNYSFESIVIEENIDYNTALRLDIAATELPGIVVQRGSKRLYGLEENGKFSTSSLGFSLPHLIGYESKINRNELDSLYSAGYLPSDFIGRTGLENQYEKNLRGTYGKKIEEVNAFGKEQSSLAEVAPIPGNHLSLYIDATVQKKLEELISDELKIAGKKRAAAVALDPNSGGVIALVSLPGFDNNNFSGGITKENYDAYMQDPDNPLFNRAIGGQYPSGSTIKPAIASAALTDGAITSQTSFLSTGGLQVGQWFFPDWKAGGHGVTNVRKSLAESVNTFYYIVGGGYKNFVGLGVDKITSYLKLFGFSSRLGIDLPGESEGFLPSRQWKEETKGERWYVGDTYNISIGQGDVLATPIQLANMTASVANGGILYEPHVVRAIMRATDSSQKSILPKVIRENFVDASSLKVVRQGMRDCVLLGSCRKLSSLPIQIAGKTGTAQWNSNKDNHAWFTSFAPYESPEIVLTILVEEGKEGSGIAAEIAKNFYAWWASYRNKSNEIQPKISVDKVG